MSSVIATPSPIHCPTGFQLIPAGPCQLGAKQFTDNPVRTVYVSAFCMGEEVTHAAYAKFVQESSGRPPYAVELLHKSGRSEIVAELSAEAAMDYQVQGVALRVGDSLRLITHPAVMALMPQVPAGFDGPQRPIVCVSWEEGRRYCEALGRQLARETGQPLIGRYPTEAEWEKAARGPNGNEYMGQLRDNDGHYWRENRPTKTTANVGSYATNGFRLHDMRGNVWEWVEDWYDADYPRTAPNCDPKGPETGELRGLRGGSWRNRDATYLSAAYRNYYRPDHRGRYFGFRPVVVLAPQDS